MGRDHGRAVAALGATEGGLGLEVSSVQVVAHNPIWADLFELLAAELREALSEYEVSIEHIGSSSVGGLETKPILDVAIGTHSQIPDKALVTALDPVGLVYRGDLGMYGGRLFVAESEPGVTLANVHVVSVDDFQWRWYQLFRDGLRADPALRRKYGALKRELAERHADDRDGYNQAKFDWVFSTITALDEASD